MSAPRSEITVAPVLSILVGLLLWQGCSGSNHSTSGGGGGGGGGGDLSNIKHIVFIVKENRSFDNYFGQFPGANGATKGTLSTGTVITLGQSPDKNALRPGP
jgi:phospholipase C